VAESEITREIQAALCKIRGRAHMMDGHGEKLVVEKESKCPVTGKRKYASEGQALATASHQIAAAHAPRDLRAYRCSWCRAWHLTKNNGTSGKDRR
jgi:hypothetical protein